MKNIARAAVREGKHRRDTEESSPAFDGISSNSASLGKDNTTRLLQDLVTAVACHCDDWFWSVKSV